MNEGDEVREKESGMKLRGNGVIVTLVCVCLLIGKGDVTISMDDENLLKLMSGHLNPQQVHTYHVCCCDFELHYCIDITNHTNAG